MTETSNLATSLQDELKRNRDLLLFYKEIGPVGTFGFTMISQDIDNATKAIMEGDVAAMIQSFNTLKNNK